MKPVLHVGERNVSSWSMRAWVALTHKGIEFEERRVQLVGDRDGARLREVSPTGQVPVLHHEKLVVPDSLAILEYVEETFPPPRWPALWPDDAESRTRARWLAAAMHSGFPQLRESMSFNLCFLPERPRASREALEEAGEVLELWQGALAAKHRPGPFLVGPFSGADVMFAPVVWRLTAFDVPAGQAAAAYMRAVLDAPAVRSWLDDARALPPVPVE